MAKGHRQKARRAKADQPVRLQNVIVVSDLHCGSRVGLMHPSALLDDGWMIQQTRFQQELWKRWREFWERWVPMVTRGEPFVLVVNGDALDGAPHGSVQQVSHNADDQIRIAEICLRPVVKMASRYFHIRGTEAHVGKSAQHEETLARMLGAEPDAEGCHARWDLLARVGAHLVHFAHHIGTSTSPYSRSSGLQRELVRGYVESGRWGDEPPAIYVRSHRHSCSEVREPSRHGWTSCSVTPAWQGLTAYSHRLGLSIENPQIGGLLIRAGDEEIYTRAKVWRLDRGREVQI